MLRLLAVAAIVLTLVACTSAVTLRHPATGAVATCGPYYTVGLYAFAANEREPAVRSAVKLGREAEAMIMPSPATAPNPGAR